jgi:hypothetical protein
MKSPPLTEYRRYFVFKGHFLLEISDFCGLKLTIRGGSKMDILMPLAAGAVAAGVIWLSAYLLDKKKEKKQNADQIDIHYED